jgi:hypothetical protein
MHGTFYKNNFCYIEFKNIESPQICKNNTNKIDTNEQYHKKDLKKYNMSENNIMNLGSENDLKN